MSATLEIVELSPPRHWVFRSTSGATRATEIGSIAPFQGGGHSQVTIALDLEARGMGRIFLLLVVRRQARKQLAKNTKTLKDLLERKR